MSDLHLEHLPENSALPHIVPDPDSLADRNILLLAGDIGDPMTDRFWKFIRQVCNAFYRVFFVCGNHEFYHHSIQDVYAHLRERTSYFSLWNFVVCNNSSITLDDRLTILGTTLWSEVPEEAAEAVLSHLNDYRLIKDFQGGLEGVKEQNIIHQTHRAFLEEQLQSIPSHHKVIVLTHHAPQCNLTSHPRFNGNITNCAFSTDLLSLIEKADIWVYGHTHYNYKRHKKLKSNQCGYNHENPVPFFKWDASFTVVN